MPELEEFTLFNEFHASPAITPKAEPDFPKLKRLRFTGFSNVSPAVFQEIYSLAPHITHLFFQLERTGDDLLEHLAGVFELPCYHRRMSYGFPQEFLNPFVEIRVEVPNKKRGYQAKSYERLIKQVTTLEPRIKVTTVTTTSYSTYFCYSLQDWLRDSTREWNFPTPHRFVD